MTDAAGRSAETRGADVAQPGRPATERLVLVADDNRDNADCLGELLQLELGCRVLTAYDGKQALDLARVHCPDVLLLDLQMPGLGGLDVAEQVLQQGRCSASPLLLAMTGRSDVAGNLAAIDSRFQRAFAKPVDSSTLFATLREHWLGTRAQRAPAPFKFLETFTRAARDVLPMMSAKNQQLSFDGNGPELTIEGDEAAWHAAFYRLMCGGIEVMGAGIVMFSARSVETDDGTHALAAHVAGSGLNEAPARRAEVLQRLGLTVEADTVAHGDARGFVQAAAACPSSGGRLNFAYQPSEGVLLRLELGVRPVDVDPPPLAAGSRAWIVDGRSIPPAVLERRLQRLGWRVWRFASPEQAGRHLDAAGQGECPELLLFGGEPPAPRAAWPALCQRMHARTRCVLLVGPGALALRDPGALPHCEIRVEPLSPGDLAEATSLAQQALAPPGPPTISHTLRGRRKVLVVDDHEVNRFVACGLLQALGYEVAAVADGLDAIEHCKLTPPDAVLMDINMPVLDGISASRRILELQKLGRVPPFAIVAATADDAPETKARCVDAGVSGYLCKPLRLESIRDELRRVGVPAAAVAFA